ncbi:MAG TPA: hypothetical protein VFA39_15790 [Steroidobacteraceae bacterium]|nr:hypothetical protein [Steroidobacteraceae bacterium]
MTDDFADHAPPGVPVDNAKLITSALREASIGRYQLARFLLATGKQGPVGQTGYAVLREATAMTALCDAIESAGLNEALRRTY